MSANPVEFLTAYANAANLPEPGPAVPSPDRRKRTRIRVHWSVLIFRGEVAEASTSITQDLSSSGFYCFTKTPFVLGEALVCAIKVPSFEPAGKHLDRNLDCRARVVRVDPQPTEGTFGIACHIEDYRFADLIGREYH